MNTVVRPNRFASFRSRLPLRIGHSRTPSFLALAAIAVAAFALIPLLFVAIQAARAGRQGLHLLFRDRVAHLLANTVELVTVSTIACAVLGTGAAWLVERTDLPGRRIWAVLLAAPLAVPAFVAGYGWLSLTPAIQGFWGAALVVTLAYYPLVYLPVAAGLRGMDPALEESARSLGCGSTQVFTRVVLPQLRPALGGGMLIVALHELAEFGAFAMLRFQTFTTAIYTEYLASFNGPAANMLASVLVLICLVLLVVEVRQRGKSRYARVGSGAMRDLRRSRLGKSMPLALIGVTSVVVLGLGVPVGAMAYWMTLGSSVAFPISSLTGAALSSLGLGLAAAVVTTLLAVPVALLVERHRSPISLIVERSTYVSHALPGIVVALALVSVAIKFAQPLYQTTPLLIGGYAILFLPLAMVGVRTAIAQASPKLTESSRALGVGPIRSFLRVTVPIIAPGLGAAAALVFLLVSTELTTTLLLAPIGTQTLATQVWSETGTLSYGAAAPYAALIVIISAPAVFLLTRSGRRAELL